RDEEEDGEGEDECEVNRLLLEEGTLRLSVVESSVQRFAEGAEEAASCPGHAGEAEDAERSAAVSGHVTDCVRNGVPALALVQGNVLQDFVHDVLLNAAVLNEHAGNRDDEDKQREQREERVVGDGGGELAAVIPHIFGRRALEERFDEAE